MTGCRARMTPAAPGPADLIRAYPDHVASVEVEDRKATASLGVAGTERVVERQAGESTVITGK